MKPTRAYLPELMLVLLGSCVALALAEGFVRLFYPHVRAHAVPGRLFEIDEQLGWKLRPGAGGTHASRYFEVTYTINALGYRDVARQSADDGTVHRILLYGDSQVFGWGVPGPRRFSSLIEARSSGVEVLNLAVPGYGLDQQILSYERDAGRLEANEIIFFVSEATLDRMRHGYIYNKHKPRFALDPNAGLHVVPIPKGAHAWTSFLYQTLGSLYLPYFVEYQIARAKEVAREDGAVASSDGRAPSTGFGALERAALERAHAVARARGHRLTLLVDFSRRLLPVRVALRKFCDEKRIGYLDIVLPEKGKHLVFGEHDRHWNEAANAVIAEQLLAQLQARGTRPGGSRRATGAVPLLGPGGAPRPRR